MAAAREPSAGYTHVLREQFHERYLHTPGTPALAVSEQLHERVCLPTAQTTAGTPAAAAAAVTDDVVVVVNQRRAEYLLTRAGPLPPDFEDALLNARHRVLLDLTLAAITSTSTSGTFSTTTNNSSTSTTTTDDDASVRIPRDVMRLIVLYAVPLNPTAAATAAEPLPVPAPVSVVAAAPAAGGGAGAAAASAATAGIAAAVAAVAAVPRVVVDSHDLASSSSLPRVVVIDNGTRMMKVGLSDRPLPQAVFPTLVGRSRRR